MLPGYCYICRSEAWDFSADEARDDHVRSAETWALDMLKKYKGNVKEAEAHTDWASPLFQNPAVAREYCKALYNPENAAIYVPDGGMKITGVDEAAQERLEIAKKLTELEARKTALDKFLEVSMRLNNQSFMSGPGWTASLLFDIHMSKFDRFSFWEST